MHRTREVTKESKFFITVWWWGNITVFPSSFTTTESELWLGDKKLFRRAFESFALTNQYQKRACTRREFQTSTALEGNSPFIVSTRGVLLWLFIIGLCRPKLVWFRIFFFSSFDGSFHICQSICFSKNSVNRSALVKLDQLIDARQSSALRASQMWSWPFLVKMLTAKFSALPIPCPW